MEIAIRKLVISLLFLLLVRLSNLLLALTLAKVTGKLQLESRSDLEAVELVDGSFGVLRLSEADEAVSLGIAVGVRIVGAGELHGIDTSELIEEFGDLVLLKTSRDVLHVKVVELNVSRLTFRAAFMLSHHNFFSFKFESVEFIDGPLGILFLLKMHEAVSAGSAVVEELDLARVDVSATTEEVGELFLVNGGLKILDEEVALLHVLAVFFFGEIEIELHYLLIEKRELDMQQQQTSGGNAGQMGAVVSPGSAANEPQFKLYIGNLAKTVNNNSLF